MIDAGRFFARFPSSMTVRTRNRLITFSILAGPFVFFIGLLLFWDAEPLPPVPPLPNPNGYEDLVRAGKMIKGEVWDYDKADLAKLREIVLTNASALALAQAGLSNPCAVTLPFSRNDMTNHLRDVIGLKNLAQALATEGELAKRENRFSDAVKSDLDLIHLGNASAHGGGLMDQMLGTAMESIGVDQLHELFGQLDAKSCRETAATLVMLDSQRQTWDEVMQQERDWSRRTFPGIRHELARVMTRDSLNKVYQSAGQKFDAQQIKTRQLIIDLAARAYELDKGHPPANLADLVPDYLKAIPQDPLTGTNMVYSPR
jgi:hypothetical protein